MGRAQRFFRSSGYDESDMIDLFPGSTADSKPIRRTEGGAMPRRWIRIVLPATVIALSPIAAGQDQGARRQPVSKAQADRWMTELSNWGRWGKDDQLGALNFVTADKRRQAM